MQQKSTFIKENETKQKNKTNTARKQNPQTQSEKGAIAPTKKIYIPQ